MHFDKSRIPPKHLSDIDITFLYSTSSFMVKFSLKEYYNNIKHTYYCRISIKCIYHVTIFQLNYDEQSSAIMNFKSNFIRYQLSNIIQASNFFWQPTVNWRNKIWINRPVIFMIQSFFYNFQHSLRSLEPSHFLLGF